MKNLRNISIGILALVFQFNANAGENKFKLNLDGLIKVEMEKEEAVEMGPDSLTSLSIEVNTLKSIDMEMEEAADDLEFSEKEVRQYTRPVLDLSNLIEIQERHWHFKK